MDWLCFGLGGPKKVSRNWRGSRKRTLRCRTPGSALGFISARWRFRARDHAIRRDGWLVPSEPVSHYNLGVLYKQVGKTGGGWPHNWRPRKSWILKWRLLIFSFTTCTGRRGGARIAATRAGGISELKKEHEGAAIPQDPEWCDYAEIYDPIDIKDSRTAGGNCASVVAAIERRAVAD